MDDIYTKHERYGCIANKRNHSTTGIGPVELKQGEESIIPLCVLVFIPPSSPDNEILHRDLPGHIEAEGAAENNTPVIIGGVVMKSQLNQLKDMNLENELVKVITEDQTESVTFAQFTYSEASDFLHNLAKPSDKEIDDPLFKFQLQTHTEEN